MEQIYKEYVEWFTANAVDGIYPLEEEELLNNCIFVDEAGDHIDAYYLLLVSPAVSRSGNIHLFLICEEAEPVRADGDIIDIIDPKYKRMILT